MLTMEEAMKQASMRFAAGEIVKGHVIEVRPKEVLVDIGYKSEVVIAGNEFDDMTFDDFASGKAQRRLLHGFFHCEHNNTDRLN